VVLLVATAILVFSNTESATVHWAAWDIDAPLYLVLLITFIAGAVGWPTVRWAWRRRRARDAERRREIEESRRLDAEVSERLRAEEERRRRDAGFDG
jgi:uncharacterized integral membrane protein